MSLLNAIRPASLRRSNAFVWSTNLVRPGVQHKGHERNEIVGSTSVNRLNRTAQSRSRQELVIHCNINVAVFGKQSHKRVHRLACKRQQGIPH